MCRKVRVKGKVYILIYLNPIDVFFLVLVWHFRCDNRRIHTSSRGNNKETLRSSEC